MESDRDRDRQSECRRNRMNEDEWGRMWEDVPGMGQSIRPQDPIDAKVLRVGPVAEIATVAVVAGREQQPLVHEIPDEST